MLFGCSGKSNKTEAVFSVKLGSSFSGTFLGGYIIRAEKLGEPPIYLEGSGNQITYEFNDGTWNFHVVAFKSAANLNDDKGCGASNATFPFPNTDSPTVVLNVNEVNCPLDPMYGRIIFDKKMNPSQRAITQASFDLMQRISTDTRLDSSNPSCGTEATDNDKINCIKANVLDSGSDPNLLLHPNFKDEGQDITAFQSDFFSHNFQAVNLPGVNIETFVLGFKGYFPGSGSNTDPERASFEVEVQLDEGGQPSNEKKVFSFAYDYDNNKLTWYGDQTGNVTLNYPNLHHASGGRPVLLYRRGGPTFDRIILPDGSTTANVNLPDDTYDLLLVYFDSNSVTGTHECGYLSGENVSGATSITFSSATPGCLTNFSIEKINNNVTSDFNHVINEGKAVINGEPRLTYSLTTLNESSNNDGSIDQVIIVNLLDPTAHTWATTTGDIHTNLVVSGLPAGLSVSPADITRVSNTQITIGISGLASSHTDGDDTNSISINFNLNAFTGGNGNNVANRHINGIAIDFDDPANASLTAQQKSAFTADAEIWFKKFAQNLNQLDSTQVLGSGEPHPCDGTSGAGLTNCMTEGIVGSAFDSLVHPNFRDEGENFTDFRDKFTSDKILKAVPVETTDVSAANLYSNGTEAQMRDGFESMTFTINMTIHEGSSVFNEMIRFVLIRDSGDSDKIKWYGNQKSYGLYWGPHAKRSKIKVDSVNPQVYDFWYRKSFKTGYQIHLDDDTNAISSNVDRVHVSVPKTSGQVDFVFKMRDEGGNSYRLVHDKNNNGQLDGDEYESSAFFDDATADSIINSIATSQTTTITIEFLDDTPNEVIYVPTQAPPLYASLNDSLFASWHIDLDNPGHKTSFCHASATTISPSDFNNSTEYWDIPSAGNLDYASYNYSINPSGGGHHRFDLDTSNRVITIPSGTLNELFISVSHEYNDVSYTSELGCRTSGSPVTLLQFDNHTDQNVQNSFGFMQDQADFGNFPSGATQWVYLGLYNNSEQSVNITNGFPPTLINTGMALEDQTFTALDTTMSPRCASDRIILSDKFCLLKIQLDTTQIEGDLFESSFSYSLDINGQTNIPYSQSMRFSSDGNSAFEFRDSGGSLLANNEIDFGTTGPTTPVTVEIRIQFKNNHSVTTPYMSEDINFFDYGMVSSSNISFQYYDNASAPLADANACAQFLNGSNASYCKVEVTFHPVAGYGQTSGNISFDQYWFGPDGGAQGSVKFKAQE